MALKEAMFYRKLKDTSVECGLCYRRCKISEGTFGFCGTRKNIGGKLYAMTYGRPCSFAVDPIEKKPFYHFWPGSLSFSIATVGCNYSCSHCQNSEISTAKPGELPEYDMPPEKVVELAQENRCNGIAYTYTEPTVFFEYAYDIGAIARKKRLYNCFVSNAYMTPETVKKSRDFLDGCRMDLKGEEEHYLKVCGGVVLDKVLDCIKNVFNAGIHTEIITLVINGDNDNKKFVERMADFLKGLDAEIPWHFTACHPAYKMKNISATRAETLEKMHDWAVGAGMKYVYSGNITEHKYENTYCPNCGELLIGRTGFGVKKICMTKNKKCPACAAKIPVAGELGC